MGNKIAYPTVFFIMTHYYIKNSLSLRKWGDSKYNVRGWVSNY